MHGKVLVVDPIATNRIVLRVKLAASHFDMLQADSIADAMQVLSNTVPDLILCAATLPDGDPVRLMRRLDKMGLAGKVPMIVLNATDRDSDRLRLLAAGIDDVLEKPVTDALLLARTRSIIRAYASASEWKLRDGTSRALGFAEPSTAFGPAQTVRIVTRCAEDVASWSGALKERTNVCVNTSMPAAAVADLAPGKAPDAFVLVVEPDQGQNMLGLLATIRSQPDTRHAAILVVLAQEAMGIGAQMLDMGANDLMEMKRSPKELALRLDALLKRKRVTDALRDTVKSGIEAAIIDPLTGLHNRRYALPHLARIAERAWRTGKPFGVLVGDMDHFKRINDTYGHAAGDAVLVETAHRLRDNLRAVDLVARIGGEEFLIVLPGADLTNAKNAAKRLCRVIRRSPFEVPGQSDPIETTISIGMTVCDPNNSASHSQPSAPETLLDRADRALYDAKAEGRNRVTLSRPAA